MWKQATITFNAGENEGKTETYEGVRLRRLDNRCSICPRENSRSVLHDSFPFPFRRDSFWRSYLLVEKDVRSLLVMIM